MSAKEFAEWCVYDRTNPGDPERSDFRTALICMTIVNMLKGKKGQRAKIEDFILKFKPKRIQPKSQSEIAMKFKAWLMGLPKNKVIDLRHLRPKRRKEKNG